MAKVEVKLNSAGVRELLKSQEMMNICEKRANAALGKLGDGHVVTTMVGKTRVNAEIAAESYEAMRDNLNNNSILKALRG